MMQVFKNASSAEFKIEMKVAHKINNSKIFA